MADTTPTELTAEAPREPTPQEALLSAVLSGLPAGVSLEVSGASRYWFSAAVTLPWISVAHRLILLACAFC